MNEQVRILAPDGEDWREAFTAADFLRMVDAGAFADIRAELVKGELQKMMPSYLEHGEYNATLVAKLIDAFRDVPARIAVDLIIRIDEFTVRAADVAVVKPNVPKRGPIDGADVILAAELADTTLERDLGEKADDYAQAGVSHYWVVDLDRREVHCFALDGGGGYSRSPLCAFDETLRTPGGGRPIVIE